jgi:hypothetical protein
MAYQNQRGGLVAMIVKTPAAKLFEERITYHASQGLIGSAIYEALEVDDVLPAWFESEDIAAILDIQPDSLKRRRKDHEPPDFIRIGGRMIKYPRPAFCRMLADNYRSFGGRNVAA